MIAQTPAIIKKPSSRLPVIRPIKKDNPMLSIKTKTIAATIIITDAKTEETISADLSTDFNFSSSTSVLTYSSKFCSNNFM